MVFSTKPLKYSIMLNYSRILIPQVHYHGVIILSLYIYISAHMHIYIHPLPLASQY